MLVRTWGLWDARALLVGVYHGAATVENSLALSQKKSETQSYRTTQQLHSWAEGKQMSTEKRARERSQQRDPK